MEKKTNRQIQAEQTKKKIQAAALDLLEKKTLEELTIQEICRTAGVSVGAFYHHLGNKEGIIIEAYKECDRYFENVVIPAFKDREPVRGIIDYLLEQIEYAERYGVEKMQSVYKAQINNGNEFFLSEDRGLPMGLAILVRRAKEIGAFRESLCAEQITRELLIISRGILYCWCTSTGTLDMHASIETMISSYLNGIAGQDISLKLKRSSGRTD
ncbi:TetR/AcrR family transcriptional regulator [Lachnospiraceae bacterium 50-23]|jgi:TetR/AcrR family fatty acid metabolism transcriptional regulator|nr:TetR/AcrR family transcriptional regulator [Dorea sp.]GFI36385.1 HTH-type transcriptional regulator BetI [Lachnospiraceae bacterium]